MKEISLPPLGYVRYVEHLGTDQRIVEAARVSYHASSKGVESDMKLINYLMQHRHTSPFEQCSITFNIKMPIFVMRQFVRHRTFRLNEVSARYTEMAEEFFIPEVWRAQDKVNKQGSVDGLNGIAQWSCTEMLQQAYMECYKTYEQLLAVGAAKEQARMVLPVGLYTEIYVNCDLHNLMHFLRLRQDSHAQKEIRDVANAMAEQFESLFPWTYVAFRKYKIKVEETE